MVGKKVLLGTIVLLFFFNKNIKAQVAPLDSLLVRALETDELLPKLIDSAIKYSPEVRRLNGFTTTITENLKISKNAILSAVSLNSAYNYGTNVSTVNNASSVSNLNSLTTVQSGFYNFGIGMQLPLTYIINRKHQIRNGKAQIVSAESQADVAKLNVKQDVIRIYQDFKLAQKLIAISSRQKQSAQINYSMAEKDFVQGQTNVIQLSTILEINNKAIIEFETNINRFQTAYLTLEAYTNTNLTNLIKQVK